jgi:hypothetical protein
MKEELQKCREKSETVFNLSFVIIKMQCERQDPDSKTRTADPYQLPFFIPLSYAMESALGGLGTLKESSDLWSTVLQLVGKRMLILFLWTRTAPGSDPVCEQLRVGVYRLQDVHEVQGQIFHI